MMGLRKEALAGIGFNEVKDHLFVNIPGTHWRILKYTPEGIFINSIQRARQRAKKGNALPGSLPQGVTIEDARKDPSKGLWPRKLKPGERPSGGLRFPPGSIPNPPLAQRLKKLFTKYVNIGTSSK